MAILTSLLQSVHDVLKANATSLGLKGVEIVILPEAKVPADSGQKTLTIHPDKKMGVTPEQTLRRKVITFGVSLSLRTRDIPNDRYDQVTYMEELSMSSVLEVVENLIESEDMMELFEAQLITDHPGDEPIYQLSDTFRYLTTNYDPLHLYPSDYLTRNKKNDKEQLYDKIAGLRMTALFDSPEIQLTNPPYGCRGISNSSSS